MMLSSKLAEKEPGTNPFAKVRVENINERNKIFMGILDYKKGKASSY
jgi:hypothetical protein